MSTKSALEITMVFVALSVAAFCALRGYQAIQAALKLTF